MNLREYLRKEWQLYVRQVLLKDKCEECGKTGHLHLHHDSDRFEDLLMETLRELNLKEKDTDDYKQSELNHISNEMIGKQMKIKHRTLCEECHKKAHSKGGSVSYLSNCGSYVFVNFKALVEERKSFFEFLILASVMDYNNQVKGEYEEILDGAWKRRLQGMIESDLIYRKGNSVFVNSNFAKKGTCNFGERNIIFTKKFLDCKDRNSVNIGWWIETLIRLNEERSQIFKRKMFITGKNKKAEFKIAIRNLTEKNIIKVKGRVIMFNPEVLLMEPHRLDELKEIYKNF